MESQLEQQRFEAARLRIFQPQLVGCCAEARLRHGDDLYASWGYKANLPAAGARPTHPNIYV
jgi:hypothetical protein